MPESTPQQKVQRPGGIENAAERLLGQLEEKVLRQQVSERLFFNLSLNPTKLFTVKIHF